MPPELTFPCRDDRVLGCFPGNSSPTKTTPSDPRLPIANSQAPRPQGPRAPKCHQRPPLQGPSPFYLPFDAQPFVVPSSHTHKPTARRSDRLLSFLIALLSQQQPTPNARSPLLPPSFFSSILFFFLRLLPFLPSPRLHNGHGAHRSSETLHQLGQKAESEDEAYQGPKQPLPTVRSCQFPTWAPTTVHDSSSTATIPFH